MGRIVIEGKRGRLVFTAGFFLLMAWLTLTGGAVGMWAALYVPVHEMGHLLCLWRMGVPVREIHVSAAGVVIHRGREFSSLSQQALCALSGPLLPLPLAGVLWGAGEAMMVGAQAFFLLSLFHLLPIWPLDGGQALFCLLLSFLSPVTAARFIRVFSFLLLFCFSVPVFLLLLRQNGNLSLLILWSYLLFCLLCQPVL